MSTPIRLSTEELEGSIGNLIKSANESLVEAIGAVAQAITANGLDENPQIAELLDVSRKYEQSKNDGWFETVRSTIATTKSVVDMTEYLKTKNYGELQVRDLKGETQKVDDSKVRAIQ